MHSNWQIDVKTDKDRDALVAQGIQLAGKWISLQAPTRTSGFSMNAKIILKDLPLNEVSNKQVLKAVKERCEVKLEVWYSNIWIDGKKMHLNNRDRFFYVADDDVAHFEKAFHVGRFKARVVKPVMHNRCSRCNLMGHCPSSEMCIAKAPVEISKPWKFSEERITPCQTCLFVQRGVLGMMTVWCIPPLNRSFNL